MRSSPPTASWRAAKASLATPFRARTGFAGARVSPDRPALAYGQLAGRRGSSEDDLPLRIVALRTLATDGV